MAQRRRRKATGTRTAIETRQTEKRQQDFRQVAESLPSDEVVPALIEAATSLPTEQKVELVAEGVLQLPTSESKDVLAQGVRDLPAQEKKDVLVESVKGLSASERDEVAKEAGLLRPTQTVTDVLWIVIVGAFVVLLLGSALGVFFLIDTGDHEILVSFVTASIGVLAGLLVPTPGQRR